MVEDLKKFEHLLQFKEENKAVTVAVGMSGGVDSSTVGYLLKKQGYNVIGITMKHWSGMDEYATDSNSKSCCSLDDIHDAKRVCDDLEIPHYVVNLTEPFKNIVVDYFIDEYAKGRTPNPCMVCNRHIKLGKLMEAALKLGADYVATGHYARIKGGLLSTGDDPRKDQVYFLSQMKKEYVKYLMFPIGELEKPQVRELAKALGVRVHAKRESQEICFVEDGKYKEFLDTMTNGKISKAGNIVLDNGTIVGKHEGITSYTIGQRKGLGISYHEPLYVLRIDSEKNEVIVGSDDKLFRNSVIGSEINLFTVDTVKDLDGLQCFAKARSRDRLHKGYVKVLNNKEIEFISEDMFRAVTPGQGLVLYTEDGVVIASSFIK